MPKERIITGIDVGTSKVTTVVASHSPENNKVSVIGVSTVPAKGIKKGVVVDIDEAVEAVAESLEGAERMAGYSVPSAFVAVDGKHISSLNSHGVVAVGVIVVIVSAKDVRYAVAIVARLLDNTLRRIRRIDHRGFSRRFVHDEVAKVAIAARAKLLH